MAVADAKMTGKPGTQNARSTPCSVKVFTKMSAALAMISPVLKFDFLIIATVHLL